MITKTLHFVTTDDNERIAVWKVIDIDVPVIDTPTTETPTHATQNIFLTHGTFSDKQTCLKIAEHLAMLGHHCYIMEWRGHGDSSLPKDKFNFETVATYDYKATFQYFFDELQFDNLHCITHSGGGVGLTMFLVQNPDYIDRVNSISMFACQAYGAVLSPKSYVKIVSAKLLTRLLGYIPARRLKMGPYNESYHTMTQWYDWNLGKNFHSSFLRRVLSEQRTVDRSHNSDHSQSPNSAQNPNGNQSSATNKNENKHENKKQPDHKPFDYRSHMPKITTPIYAISARGDTFVSPTGGCRLFFEGFDNPANVFREYALEHGDLDDYTHSRIMISRNAATEIWPTVTAWIEQHAG